MRVGLHCRLYMFVAVSSCDVAAEAYGRGRRHQCRAEAERPTCGVEGAASERSVRAGGGGGSRLLPFSNIPPPVGESIKINWE